MPAFQTRKIYKYFRRIADARDYYLFATSSFRCHKRIVILALSGNISDSSLKQSNSKHPVQGRHDCDARCLLCPHADCDRETLGRILSFRVTIKRDAAPAFEHLLVVLVHIRENLVLIVVSTTASKRWPRKRETRIKAMLILAKHGSVQAMAARKRERERINALLLLYQGTECRRRKQISRVNMSLSLFG